MPLNSAGGQVTMPQACRYDLGCLGPRCGTSWLGLAGLGLHRASGGSHGSFRPAGLEDRPSSGSWGPSEQNNSSFDPSRVRSGLPFLGGGRKVEEPWPGPGTHTPPSPQSYGEGTHFSDSHGGLSASAFLGSGLGGECGPAVAGCRGAGHLLGARYLVFLSVWAW